MPTLYTVPAFDAEFDQQFRFDAVGSSPNFNSVNLVIYNNKIGVKVYDHTFTQLDTTVTVPAGTLTNGVQYRAQVRTIYHGSGEPTQVSPWSNIIFFYCYTTPVLTFENFPTNGIVGSSSYNFVVSYSQKENELLQTYTLNLYNSSKDLIMSSGLLYPVSSTIPTMGSYTFQNMSNNSVYYVEYTITTVEGTVVTTGLKLFTVNYIQPDEFTLLDLSNNCREGYVLIRSNIKFLTAETYPSPPIYINGTAIDLRNGKYADWSKNISFSGNFVAKLWFRNPTVATNPNGSMDELFGMVGDEGKFHVRFLNGYADNSSTKLQAYCELKASLGEDDALDPSYVVYSNFIDILPQKEWYCLWITQENNVYKLHLEPV